MNIIQWFPLGEDGGVLELHEDVTKPGPALELHVHGTFDGPVAFWASDDGTLLRWVPIGEA